MLTIDGVSVCYNRIDALSNIDLELPLQHICALIGPNGAGKSTLFKTAMGLITPTTGSVSINERISYVPQHDDVNWNFPINVHDVVKTGAQKLWLGRMSQSEKQRVSAALEATSISNLAKRHISELSGGQKKRVFVARALAQGARIMLLDEPFAGVDQETEASLIELFKQLRDQGTTLLIATHNLDQVPLYADSVVMLNRQIVAQGPAESTLTKNNLIATFSGRES